MTQIFATDEFAEWFAELGREDGDAVIHVVTLLELSGVLLGAPHSSALLGARFPLRELRPKQGRSPLRIVYAFDPRRDAVLIIGGDKSGDPKFYEHIIPRAERIWKEYLAEQEAGEHEEEEDEP